MVWMQKSFTDIAFLFFVPLVFIGAFFLLNLTLAVIKSQFTEEHKKKKRTKKPKKKGNDDVEDEDLLDEITKKKRKAEREEFRDLALRRWRVATILKKFAGKLAARFAKKR
jgi:predicted membrane protein